MGSPKNGAQLARILLLEGDAGFAALLKAYLRTLALDASSSPVSTTAHFSGVPELDSAGTLAAALELLARRHYDLIIADLNVPDSSGLATLTALRGAGDRLILVLTADEDGATARQALERGAYDLLRKADMNPEELRRLVRLAALQAATVRSLRDSEAGVRQLIREQAVHLRYQERIARLGQLALEKRDAGELATEAVQTLLEGLVADAVAYVERTAQGEVLLRSVVGLAEPAGAALAAIAPGTPLHQALAGGRPALVDCPPPPLPFAWSAAARRALLTPVGGEDGARGALCVLAGREAAFGAAEMKFAEVAANVLSAGLQRMDRDAKLSFLAQFDGLTALPNRALLSDRFAQMIVQARRRGGLLGVLFIDLDDFKIVNDTLGHAAGDDLLVQAARRLESCVRAGDTVARISGDEFAVILGDLARPDDAAVVARKIIEALSRPAVLREQEVFVTASVGIACFPGDGESADALLGAADAAMYRAKQGGRNGYQFYTAEINQRTRARAQLGSEMHRALERNEFMLAFQPKFDLRGGAPGSAEALLRWRHPERGIVSPGEFIPVLEETGLIVPVGEWALRQACADIRAWQEAGLAPLPVAVNLSARQFRQPDLDARVLGTVQAAGVDMRLIELEITESHLMHDPEHAARVMRALHAAGMHIAVDDFGTGYSSLAYLTRFPLSSLKIDRSFVAGALTDAASAAIVRTIIEMAHTLGFAVVAEGVETEAQASLLRELGCDQAQGYWFAKPMPASELARLLRRADAF